jgi:hypothetical protein
MNFADQMSFGLFWSSTSRPLQGVPEREQKLTKTSGRFPDLKIFSGTNVLMIRDSV